MPTDNSDLIEAARTEADLCKNEGADDIASLLWKLADALQARAAVAPQPEWIVGSDERGTTLRYSPAVAPQPAPPREPVAWVDPQYIHARAAQVPYGKYTSPVTTFMQLGWLPLFDATPASGDTPALSVLTSIGADTPAIPKGDARRACICNTSLGNGHAEDCPAAGDAVPVALTDEQCDDMIWSVTRPYACNSGHLDREMYRALIRAGYTAAPAEKKG